MEKMFRVNLYNVENMLLPFVEVVFKVAEGKMRKGLLMIDTCSNSNVLSKGILQYLDPDDVIEGEVRNIMGIQRRGSVCKGRGVDFVIGDMAFHEVFYEGTVNLDEFGGNGVIMGFVGNEFLKEYGLILDYQDQCLRQSDDRDVTPDDCRFYFPLAYGMNRYKCPAVVATKDDNKYILFTDSGNDLGTISENDMKAMGKDYHSLDKEEVLHSVSGDDETSLFHITFDLYTMLADKSLQIVPFENDFYVSNSYNHLVDANGKEYNGKPLLPITGLIGSPFMLKNKWILDFDKGAVYSLK